MFYELFKSWCESHDYRALRRSPLVRNDEHLFTFSPFEDLEEDYLEERDIRGFKIQDCFRNVFPQNLVNPLSTPLQTLVSIHDFSFSDSLSELKRFVNGFLIDEIRLDKTDVYYIIPDDPSVVSMFCSGDIPEEKTIVIDRRRLSCNLPLDGIHYYIKIVQAYKGGVVTVANFVLVNYHDGSFQLDSVVYPERIRMIMDEGDFLYDLKSYGKCKEKFTEGFADVRMFNFTLGNLNAVNRLRLLVEEGNNKHGYTLKHLEKELFQECLSRQIDFVQMLALFAQNGIVDGDFCDYLNGHAEKFSQNRRQCLRMLRRRLKTVQSVDEVLFNDLHGELGCTREDVILTCRALGIDNELNNVDIQQNFAFYYDKSRNTMTNPKRQYH